MWVYSTLENTTIQWAGKKFVIKHGINELPPDVGQAFFLFALPENRQFDDNEMEGLRKNALLRWQLALQYKQGPPNKDFLLNFLCAETREEIEKMLKDAAVIK